MTTSDTTLRVLHLVHRWELGGVRSHIRDLSRGLSDAGHAVYVAAHGLDTAGERPPFVPFRLELYAPGGRKSLPGLLRSAARLHRLISAERIGIVHDHSRYATLLSALAAAGTGAVRVYTNHNIFPDLRRLPFYPRHIIHPSGAARDAFEAAVRVRRPRSHAVVIHGTSFRPAERRAARCATDPFRIVFIGRFAENKGGDVLLHALRSVRNTTACECSARFIGEGPEEHAWRALASGLRLEGTVAFESASQRVADELACADAVILPSRSMEALPVIAIEAMLAGCPLIVSDLPVFQELSGQGRFATVFPAGDAEGLAGAVTRAIEDPAAVAAIAGAARDHAAAAFTVERMTRETVDIYRAACASRTPRWRGPRQ